MREQDMDDRFAAALAAGERLFHIVEHGDLEELRAVFTEDAKVWHNTDEKLVDVDTTIRNLDKIRSGASVFHYTDIRREPTPSGFVQQHLLIVEMPDGRSMRDLACCICRVEDGRIAWMDAYHDSAVVDGMAHRKG
jgi:ketosteroid isomerase-like protein